MRFVAMMPAMRATAMTSPLGSPPDWMRARVSGRTVGQVVESLAARYPGVLAVLMEDGDLRPGVAVSVGDQLAQDGLLEPVGPDDEVHFLPAFAGG